MARYYAMLVSCLLWVAGVGVDKALAYHILRVSTHTLRVSPLLNGSAIHGTET